MKTLLPLIAAAPIALACLAATPAFALHLSPAFSPVCHTTGTTTSVFDGHAKDTLRVLWKGKLTSLDALGEASGSVNAEHLAAVRKQIDRYLPWVTENDYHIALTDDARVLLIASTEKLVKGHLKLVSKTLATFDEIMPVPDRSGSKETFRDGEWGVREHVPDAEPVVLIELKSGEHYQSLLGSLEESEPATQTWATIHASEPGFDEVRVMSAAWQSAPDGFEVGDVWRSENELVNRLSRLLTYRSYGPQPTWMSQATAWAVEQAVIGNIYCFPYRQEFISVSEHTGWESRLKGEFKKRDDRPLQLGEFADWHRGTWDLDYAAYSWGFVKFLVEHKPGALSALAEANRIAYKAGFTEDHGDGTWSTNPSFEVPQEAQMSILQEAAGSEVLDEASDYFRSWKRYKPAKKRR